MNAKIHQEQVRRHRNSPVKAVFRLLKVGAFMTVLSSSAQDLPSSFSLPSQAVDNAAQRALERGVPFVISLGAGVDAQTGKHVEGFAFVFPRKNFHHRPGHGGGPGGGDGGGGDAGSTCFQLLASGARWRVTEPYVLQPAVVHGDGSLSEGDVVAQTEEGLLLWNVVSQGESGFSIFGSRNEGAIVDGADTDNPDGKNEVYFAPIADAGVIAVTITWGVFRGPPFQRELVEWDMVLDDDGDFVWGDVAKSGDNSLMDYLNIFAHEAGHAAGLDHPEDTCTEETMYRFADVNETKKRSLEAGDIAGIRELY